MTATSQEPRRWRRASTEASKFLVLGRAGMDLYADPPGTATEDAGQFFACMGGSSANIAAALTRLGAKAALLSCVSDDAVGNFCLNEMDRYGIDRRHVHTVSGQSRTSLAVVETRLKDHQSVIYRNNAADFQMTVAHVEAVDFAAYDALIATGTALAAEPSQGATFHAFDLARQAGLPVILDIDYRPYSWPSAQDAAQTYGRAAAMCDIVIGNDVEFGIMAGSTDKGLAAAGSLAQSAAIVIYKMGELGAITFAQGREIRSGIYTSHAIKPTGAGDSFLGATIDALFNGSDVETAVLRGSAAAALVVSRVGCAPAMPTARDIDDFIAGQAQPMITSKEQSHAHSAP